MFVSARAALAHVHSGQRVFVQGAAATPRVLLEALVECAPELDQVEVVHMHAEGPAPHIAPEMDGHLRHRALFVGSNVREAVNAGRADFVPIFLSDIPALFTSGQLPLDVALIHVSPPDVHGYCSLGTSVDVVPAAIQSARLVIAQVNPRMPRTLGNSFVQLSQIDLAVEVDMPLFEHNVASPTELEQRIGAHVADLVEDGATLQLGIGGIPNAALAALSDRKDLGVHTEMFSDGLLDLVEAGVVTGEAKSIHPGKIITTFLMGSQRLYDWIHDNPMLEMHPVDYTNDTSIIRRNTRMTAINSALQVDLTGQVCADSIGTRIYSGVGGQMDFMRGAALSSGGKAIIALPSTARGGSVSRIVPTLTEGAGVTTTRAHVQYVVTEFGVAYLHGKSIRERARALSGIAHPQFRDQLIAWARDEHYV
ncbi:MAG TPA: acetyl-CoA hydrolase/transferase C-terminal domain-containing protein [Chloroflexota bacterium]|jgi:acyl-CoA hydrolase